jgi:hypothetical protein
MKRRENDMEGRQYGAPRRIGRRRLLVGTGAAAAVVGSVGAVGRVKPASATELRRAKPAPLPIPGGFDAGPPVGFVHAFLPGPVGSFTPFFRLPGGGLDVEPSTLTNFKGFTAFAVLAGQAEGSDGKTYNVEFDLRIMEGEYIAEDGSHHRGAFGFF